MYSMYLLFVQMLALLILIEISSVFFLGVILLNRMLNKKNGFTILMALLLILVCFLGSPVMVFGDSVNFFGDMKLVKMTVELNRYFVFFIGPLMAAYAAHVYLRRYSRVVVSVALISIIPSFFIVFFGDRLVFGGIFQAVPVQAFSAVQFMLTVVPVAVGGIFLAVTAFRSWQRTKSGSDWYLTLAGLFAAGQIVVGGMVLSVNSEIVATLGFLYMFAFQTILLIGLIGKNSPEEEVEHDPLLYLRSNFALKIAVYDTFLTLLSVLFIVYAATLNVLLIKEKSSFALLDKSLSVSAAKCVDMVTEAKKFARQSAVVLEHVPREDWPEVIGLWEDSGQVLISVYDEAGGLIGTQVTSTDDGHSKVALTQVSGLGWVGMATAPIGEDGSIIKVFYSHSFLDELSGVVSDNFSLGIITVDGGFETFTGEPLESGEAEAMISSQGSLDRSRDERLKRIASYRLEPIVLPGDDSIYGYIYGYVTTEFRKRVTENGGAPFLLVGLITGVSVLLITRFATRRLIDPVVRLGQEARRVEGGDFNVNIDSDSPDELGLTMRAFSGMAAAVRQRTDQLDEKIREQRDFLNYVAHELKAPIGAVRWLLEMAEESDDRHNEELTGMINDASKANERMRLLVSDLLDFARLERGALVVKPERVEVLRAVDSAISEFGQEIAKQGIKVVKNYPDGDTAVLVDPKRLGQVLANVVGNAIKYSPSGSEVQVSVREVDESRGRSGRFMLVSVRDFGMGIPENQQAMIFSRFYRAENAVESGLEGTGLGLYVSKRLLEMQSGDIWFTSVEGKGSTFEFTLPIIGDQGQEA